MRARRLQSPQLRLERAGTRLEPQPESSLRPREGGPAREGRQVGLAGSGSGFALRNRRAWGVRREAAGRPRRGASVPTNRVSHGWSEDLFLKRLQGGHKQPPTSFSLRAVDWQPVRGRGWGGAPVLEWCDCLAGGRGSAFPPAQAGGQAHAPPRGGLGSVVVQLQGTVADQSSRRRRKLWSSDIRELPQASRWLLRAARLSGCVILREYSPAGVCQAPAAHAGALM